MRNFVFLNLPESFRLVDALADGKRDFWWRTTRLKNEIEVGDRVFMWQGKGREEQFRGVHAVAEVSEKPRKLAPSEFDGYWVGEQSKAFEDEHTRLKILEWARPNHHLRQGDIHNVPTLLLKGVFDGAQGVNFRLSEGEADDLYAIWRLHADVTEYDELTRPVDLEDRFDESARETLEKVATKLRGHSLQDLEKLIAKPWRERPANLRKITVASIPRDPAVVAYARVRAQYRCEVPNCSISLFETEGGLPFVEVHHIVPLGKGGQDHVANVACLCPSHHREAHHGRKSKEIEASLKQQRGQRPAT